MPKDWQDLVTQALLMYDDVDDIKRALRGRFGSGKHGNVAEWYEYLVWLNEKREKDKLFKDWSDVWQRVHGGRGRRIDRSFRCVRPAVLRSKRGPRRG